ncbi:MAG: hypothetical protein ACYSW3_26500 [Planctomycetota bacterium]|jgi:hypothetical protein
MADAFFRTNYIDVPGPDGVTMDAKGPDMKGKNLSWVAIAPPFFIGMTEKIMVRAFGDPAELNSFKLEPQVQEIPEPAVEAQIKAHTGTDKQKGKVKDLWKVRE